MQQAEELAAEYRASARLQNIRAEKLVAEVERSRELLMGWSGSRTARLGRVVRAGWLLLHGALPTGTPVRTVVDRVREVARTEGTRALSRRLAGRIRLRWKARKSAIGTGAIHARPVSPGVLEDLAPHVLIIAELRLPQCAKYRVWQRKEELEFLGWMVTVVEWRDHEQALSSLQTCTEVIFYRVPAFQDVKALLAEAKRLGLTRWWDVDDLIFDANEYRDNGNLETLGAEERRQLLMGVSLYRDCMLTCDRALASTPVLAAAMQRAGVRSVQVVENALDAETLAIAEKLRARGERRQDDGSILVVYGSGTRTHDADFRSCATGFAAAMAQEPRLRLRIVGDLALPDVLRPFGARVEHLEARDYASYMALLAQADVTVAPLVPSRFNDAKSNIKFLEAAVLGVPAVCSPRATFRQVVESGVTGFLAETPEEWRDALLMLVGDPALRVRMGEAARAVVLDRYRPDIIAERQLAPCFPRPAERPAEDQLRVLCVNTYFAPRSFGGATLVAEEMVRHLARTPDIKVAVFTAGPLSRERNTASCRYEVDGVPVVASPLPVLVDSLSGLDNPRCSEQFAAWLDAFQPDVVHFHCVQGLGLGLLRECVERSIPHVVTLHDAWWLCDRQFMVRENGRYCFQRRIDPKVCAACVETPALLDTRIALMESALRGAALLLSPSESHRTLYMANGIAPERIRTNRNGFLWPSVPRPPRPRKAPLRFGYVGGVEKVKGYPLLKEAFEGLERGDWELVLVDNKLNLGVQSIVVEDWKVHGQLRVLPAYGPETMDAFFAELDVLVFPSQWMESYGLTVREALARDIWVLTTTPGGQAEDVTEGVNGTLVPLGSDAQTLRAAVTDLLDSPERFENYRNPEKDFLPTFAAQAAELQGMLAAVAAGRSL